VLLSKYAYAGRADVEVMRGKIFPDGSEEIEGGYVELKEEIISRKPKRV